jgi:hypothetical protein
VTARPCVVVKTAPYGFEAAFSCSVADVFDPDELTISDADQELPVKVYRSGEWQEATVTRDGHVLYQFRSSAYQQAVDDRLHELVGRR